MPAGNPQYGELWSMTDAGGRVVEAIVADNSHSLLTFVSLTGVRMRFAYNRSSMWNYVRSAIPTSGCFCERHGCANLGFMRYSSALQAQNSFGYACPRHVPIGMDLLLMGSSPNLTLNWRSECVAIPCPACHDPDPVEDARRHPLESDLQFWNCNICSFQWVSDTSEHTNSTADIQSTLARIRRSGEEPISVHLPMDLWQNIRRSTLQFPVNDTVGTVATLEGIPWAPNQDLSYVVFHLGPGTRQRRPIQRLGGQPNRSGVSGGQHTGGARPRSVQEQLLALANQEPEDLTSILAGTTWVQKGGTLIEIIEVSSRPSPTSMKREVMVVFKRQSETHSPSVVLARQDFLKHHRPYEEPKSVPIPEVSVGDEYESANGDYIRIMAVDLKKELLHVQHPEEDNRTASIKFPKFIPDQWKKVVRLTAYERLLLDDEL